MDKGFFRSIPNKKPPYTIVIPPPNVTGVLHMGHMLNNTIQDVLIRRARMMGFNACWVPGTDHASIATEAKVVALLKEKGIEKQSLSREDFLKHAWEWKEKYGGIILEQLKKLGASCDWDRTRFTMEEDLSEAVIEVFIDLYNKGLIYRGVRMVNWDPEGLTAISDEEVIYKEVNSKLYYVSYPIEGSDEKITIATTRPETILGDTAVCVHPEDPRYKHLVGKNAIIPFVNRPVPIIADTYIDMEFGTGALKVTPAHDINDYNLGLKHNLQSIDTIDERGKMSPAAQFYIGMDRFVCRKQIAKDLQEMGLLVKVEDIVNKNGFSERTNAVIEPKLSVQWFLKMSEMAKPALDVVMSDEVELIPEKFKNTYKHWMENVHDWCISRQLWWGHRIPAWYNAKGEVVVAKTEAEAIELFKAKGLNTSGVHQDEDVLDTWFSSWLWPISVFDGFKNPENEDIKYYYPTNDLVTAPEILFFWVARMIMAGLEYRKDIPFKKVYLTGIVRDKLGRKMSKSLGNSPDPIELIEKYSADGVRVGMLLSAPAGNDLLFDESYCQQGRNFANKVWNAFRLVQGWERSNEAAQSELAHQWFAERLNASITEIEADFAQYRLSEALMKVYKLVWDDFCSWYLEKVKPNFGSPIAQADYDAIVAHFESLLKLMHPFMPFITEEIWHELNPRKEAEYLIVSDYPSPKAPNNAVLTAMEWAQECISQIRNIRNQKGISPKTALALQIHSSAESVLKPYLGIIQKLANVEPITFQAEIKGGQSFLVDKFSMSIVMDDLIDAEAEKTRISSEIEYLKGFLKSVEAKLSNERFVQNAKPEIVENERKKQADAVLKLEELSKSLAVL
jgi:valyl-tRNA synthetase